MPTGRIVIIGAGITGLTAAHLLRPHVKEIVVLEKSSRVGGLCRTDFFNNTPFDICGGHIFNSTNQSVKNFIFSLTPESEWNKRKRNAKIWIDGRFIGFPFENNMINLGHRFFAKCMAEMKQWADLKSLASSDLSSYLLWRFGPTACEKYHFPYNEKLWQYPLSEIGTRWAIKGKIPTSTVDQVEKANLSGGAMDTSMIHSEFYCPKHGGIEQAIIKPLLTTDIEIKTKTIPLKIQFQQHEFKIQYYSLLKGTHVIDCDLIISTIPLDSLFDLCGYKRYNLPTHGTDILACRSDFFLRHPDISWIYIPEKKYWWHRIANISYNIGIEQDYMIVEAPGGTYKKGMSAGLSRYKFNIEKIYSHPITYPTEPLYDMQHVDNSINILKDMGIFTLGRFGKHKYWNMDKCINDVMNAVPTILERL